MSEEGPLPASAWAECAHCGQKVINSYNGWHAHFQGAHPLAVPGGWGDLLPGALAGTTHTHAHRHSGAFDHDHVEEPFHRHDHVDRMMTTPEAGAGLRAAASAAATAIEDAIARQRCGDYMAEYAVTLRAALAESPPAHRPLWVDGMATGWCGCGQYEDHAESPPALDVERLTLIRESVARNPGGFTDDFKFLLSLVAATPPTDEDRGDGR